MTAFTSDTFTDVAGTAITSHTGEVGAVWTANPIESASGPMVITAQNRLRNGADGTSGGQTWYGYTSGVPSSADVEATWGLVDLTSISDATGVTLRQDTTANTMYMARHKNNAVPNVWAIEKSVAGVGTTLGTLNETLNYDGGALSCDFSVLGSTLTFTVDGVTKVGPLTDSAISAAGRAGVRSTSNTLPSDSTGLQIDNLVVSIAITALAQELTGSAGLNVVASAISGKGAWASIRPIVDVSAGSWTDQSGGTSDLHTPIGELPFDDSTYDQASYATTDVLEERIKPFNVPSPANNFTFSYRFDKDYAGGQRVDLQVELRQGASTQIVAWTHTDISGTVTEADQALTAPQIALITDPTDVRVRVTQTRQAS